MNPNPIARAAFPALGLVAFFGLFAVRDAPSQIEKAYAEFTHLRAFDNEERRVELFFRDPAQQKVVRRYFAFLEAIRAATPDEARVGLRGLPAKPLYKFAHYYLFPRHPFAVDGLDDDEAAALDLDTIAEFPELGRNWRIESAR